MESKTLRTIAIAALIIAIGGVTLGYAALSQVLNINTDSTVQSSNASWNVHFENASAGEVTGTADKGSISLDNTTVTLTGVVLKAPGDSVSYTFDIVNDGEINAKIGTYSPKTPTFTGSGDTKDADETLVETSYEYTLTYVDGGTAIAQNDTLNAGETKTVKLTVTYKDTATQLPTADVTVNGSGATITYVQA